jgi:hypothetical protein
MLAFTPFISCFSVLAERKSQPDGLFNFRKLLIGTPSSGLPGVLLLLVVSTVGAYLTLDIKEIPVNAPELFSGAFWAAAALIAMWAICQLSSVISRTLTAARGLALATLATLVLLPMPVLQVFAEIESDDGYLNIHPLFAAFVDVDHRMNAGYLLMCIALFAFVWAKLASPRTSRLVAETSV